MTNIITLCAIGLAGGIFALDLNLPLGVAGGVPYVALIMLGRMYEKPGAIINLGLLSTILTIAGYFFSPEGGVEWVVLTNRAYALIAIWITVFTLILIKKNNFKLKKEIVERKNFEKQLTQSLISTEKANKAKSDFLSSMSHELRTPLNAILGFSQMLLLESKENSLSQDQKEYVQYVLDSGGHLLSLVDGLLDLSIIEKGQTPITVDCLSPGKMISDSISLIILEADKRNITIKDLTINYPTTKIFTDKKCFRQIILSLLTNAVQYNKDGGEIIINCKETDDGFIRIIIKDTGIGIPNDKKENIFKIFNLGEAGPLNPIQGMGIGIPVTKKLLHLMGGKIGFSSEEGVGSTFWFDLPCVSDLRIHEWKETYLTGITLLDDDHRILINLLNKCSRESLVNKLTIDTLEETRKFLFEHGQREVSLMRDCEYPHSDEHERSHNQILIIIENLKEFVTKDEDPQLIQHFTEYFQCYLLRHLCNADGEFALFYKKKEIEDCENYKRNQQ